MQNISFVNLFCILNIFDFQNNDRDRTIILLHAEVKRHGKIRSNILTILFAWNPFGH